jgi:hypothetical protein
MPSPICTGADLYCGRVNAKLTVTAGVIVRADPQQVWDMVVDWSRQHQWILATTTEGGHGLGAKVTGRTGIGPFRFADPMEITEWVPPRRCSVSHLGTMVRGRGMFEVLPRDDPEGAEFRWTEVIELPVSLPPPLARLVATAFVGPVTRIGLGWSLRRFARLAGTKITRRSRIDRWTAIRSRRSIGRHQP